MRSAILLVLLTCPGLLPNRVFVKANTTVTSESHYRIVFIRPVFTAAAYQGYPDASFYKFYMKYSGVPKDASVKTDLNLLNSTVNQGDWGKSWSLSWFFDSRLTRHTSLFRNATVLTDIDVDAGKLFYATNETRRFDVAVLGFSEYVTMSEYENYKRFVETGGGLFLLDACNFVAEVRYQRATNKVSLVKGHGWEFNGTVARRGPFHRWTAENTNWIGSNYALFYKMGYHVNGAVANTTHPLSIILRSTMGAHVFSSYEAHEENAITNSSDKVIAYWNITGLKLHNLIVAVYEHDYLTGTVIHTGIFGSDILAKDRLMQLFLTAAVERLASILTTRSTETTITTGSQPQNPAPPPAVLGAAIAVAILLLVIGVIFVVAFCYVITVRRKPNVLQREAEVRTD
jgi:hypothetical protein